jgi:hypothetical protein
MASELSGSHPGPEDRGEIPKKNREAAPRNIPPDAVELASWYRLPEGDDLPRLTPDLEER